MKDKLKVLIVGAHPDDCELCFGGFAALYAEAGHDVLMISMTDGWTGHFSMKPARLAPRRRREARNAAAVLGVRSKVLPFHSTELCPDIPTRKRFLAEVRRFAPDLLLIHKLEDYHPDHRASVQLAYDISYLVGVPWASETKPMKQPPVIMHSARECTTTGAPERIIGLPIDRVWDKKLRAMHEHTSQFYEWLAWERGDIENVPKTRSGRLKYLEAWRGPHYEAVARWCRSKVKSRKYKPFRYAEAAYAAKAGLPLTPERIERLFPFEKLVIGF